jgi:hypothetical protein
MKFPWGLGLGPTAHFDSKNGGELQKSLYLNYFPANAAILTLDREHSRWGRVYTADH